MLHLLLAVLVFYRSICLLLRIVYNIVIVFFSRVVGISATALCTETVPLCVANLVVLPWIAISRIADQGNEPLLRFVTTGVCQNRQNLHLKSQIEILLKWGVSPPIRFENRVSPDLGPKHNNKV